MSEKDRKRVEGEKNVRNNMKRKERRKGKQHEREKRGKYKERKGERGGPQMTDLPVN